MITDAISVYSCIESLKPLFGYPMDLSHLSKDDGMPNKCSEKQLP